MSKRKERPLVIIGCGRFGACLASTFYDEGAQVLIIDKNKEAFRKLLGSYGGLTLVGDATDLSMLKEAEVKTACTIFVVTDNDNINMMIAQMIRLLYQHDCIVCRLTDPEKKGILEQNKIKTISPIVLMLEKSREILKEEKA